MKKVLFANAYFYRLDAKQWQFKQPYPPLGTLIAASCAREAGFKVSLFDACLAEGPSSLASALESFRPDIVVLYEDGFNYLTKMCLTVMRDAAMEMVGMSKACGSEVVVCSSDASDHFVKYLNAGADFIIRGEGERTLLEVLERSRTGTDPASIKGLAYRSGEACVTNPSRPVIHDLDQLPMPAWDLVDIKAYEEIWRIRHGYFSLNIATTRGCPFKCNWCAKPIYGNRYNSRSPKNVVDEIEFLLEKYRPEHFWICDDIFGLKPGWVKAFLEELSRRGLTIRFKIQSRVDLLLEDGAIEALKASGLETVWVGAESGSQKILDAMDKGTTIEQIRQATKKLKAHEIRVGFFLQFGYPGETKGDIENTIRMVEDLMPDEIGISVSYPLPGTIFYERVKASMLGKTNWKDSDELAMMYDSPYPAGFYKILHRYVHNRYRVQRGLTGSPRNLRNVASALYNFPQSIVRKRKLNRITKSIGR